MQRTSSRAIAAAIALAVAVTWSSALAVRFDWTAQELACARTIGVDLRDVTDASSPYVLRHQAWVAELIVFGSVQEIRNDPRGAYHTLVRIGVSTVAKGTVPSNTIWVDLVSGKYVNPLDGRPVSDWLAGEPEFQVGETVLLFLQREYTVLPGEPTHWARQEGHYGLIDDTKWIVVNGMVQQPGRPSDAMSIPEVGIHINTALGAQRSNCQ